MTISIIIPAFQCEKKLCATVAQVLQSNLPLAELLLVDDGSTDGTAALCDRLSEENETICCIHKPNGGVSSARNMGIEAAKGDYLWFVDADDDVQPIPENILSDVRAMMPDMVLFGMEFQYFRGAKLMKQEPQCVSRRMELQDGQLSAEFSELFRKNYLSPVWNKLIKRSVLIDGGIRFDHALTNYEDLAFTLQALADCRNILVLPDVLYHYKTDYDHDRTVDRIARIDELAANTDLIADSFFRLAERQGFDSGAEKQVRAIVMQIFLELFRVKMLTTPLSGVKKQCEDFSADRYFRLCADVLPQLSGSTNRLYDQIVQKKVVPIWLRIQYRKIRSRAARIIKPILKRA